VPKTTIPTPLEPPRPDGWNYSTTRDVAVKMLGPHARVWHRAGEPVRIGLEHGARRVILGEGATFLAAVEASFLEPLRQLEELRRLEAEAASTRSATPGPETAIGDTSTDAPASTPDVPARAD
jgi:hypothetical protein